MKPKLIGAAESLQDLLRAAWASDRFVFCVESCAVRISEIVRGVLIHDIHRDIRHGFGEPFEDRPGATFHMAGHHQMAYC